jgi:hypothetical protein
MKRARNIPLHEEEDDIQEVLPVKSEPKEIPTPSGSTSNYDNQALVQQVSAGFRKSIELVV